MNEKHSALVQRSDLAAALNGLIGIGQIMPIAPGSFSAGYVTGWEDGIRKAAQVLGVEVEPAREIVMMEVNR